MENYFSIGAAAKAVHLTGETLRHYDRIGLVKPSRREDGSSYRYYTQQDLVRLQTVRALQQMDLSLEKIKEVLSYENLEKIIDFLSAAERRADEKMASLANSKAKIQLAKADYERTLGVQDGKKGIWVKEFPERVILLSDTLEVPTLDTLWGYLSHFYEKMDLQQREEFVFEDVAGIYTAQGRDRLFAVCMRYGTLGGIRKLPGGRYLCTDCVEDNRGERVEALLQQVEQTTAAQPEFVIQQIMVSGILQWQYQVQVFLGENEIAGQGPS